MTAQVPLYNHSFSLKIQLLLRSSKNCVFRGVRVEEEGERPYGRALKERRDQEK
jgi:hypothetical protein